VAVHQRHLIAGFDGNRRQNRRGFDAIIPRNQNIRDLELLGGGNSSEQKQAK